MKISTFIILLLFPILTFGNMAQPWVDGAKHSTLYGAKNCRVVNENIFINLLQKDGVYFAKYKIKYTIHSDVNQKIPLLFLGLGLGEHKSVIVNGVFANLAHPYAFNANEVRFSETERLSVAASDLISFEAKLQKGENTVYIEYDADLEYNTIGFVRNYKLEYSVYPSKFWKSFGTITLQIFLNSNLTVKNSNIGQPNVENDVSKWTLDTIETDTITMDISQKTSAFSSILLFLEPIGIAGVGLILMFVYHLKLIRLHRKKESVKTSNIITIGSLTVPILFYVIYFMSFDLIDFSLNQDRSNHGYVFLFVFTSPLLIIIYWFILKIFDKMLIEKYKDRTSVS